MSYQVIELGIDKPIHALSRSEAERVYHLRVDGKEERIQQLTEALADDGYSLEWNPVFLDALDDWFRCVIEESKKTSATIPAVVLSLANDIALFIGELIIKDASGVKWHFLTTDSKELGYQKHVLIGFTKVKDKDYYIDIDYLVGAYAHRLFSGKEKRKKSFRDIYKTAVKRA